MEDSGYEGRTGADVGGEKVRRTARGSTAMLSLRRVADVSHAAQSLTLLLEAIGRGEVRASAAEVVYLEGAVDGLRTVTTGRDPSPPPDI